MGKILIALITATLLVGCGKQTERVHLSPTRWIATIGEGVDATFEECIMNTNTARAKCRQLSSQTYQDLKAHYKVKSVN